jgi:hypothetical protein
VLALLLPSAFGAPGYNPTEQVVNPNWLEEPSAAFDEFWALAEEQARTASEVRWWGGRRRSCQHWSPPFPRALAHARPAKCCLPRCSCLAVACAWWQSSPTSPTSPSPLSCQKVVREAQIFACRMQRSSNMMKVAWQACDYFHPELRAQNRTWLVNGRPPRPIHLPVP